MIIVKNWVLQYKQIVNFMICLVATMFCVVLLSSSVFAQTDLKGTNLNLTASSSMNVAYTNSSSTLSTIYVSGLNSGTNYTYSAAITGNICVDVTHQGYTDNGNRFIFSNTGNNFTGGLIMRNGIVFMTNDGNISPFKNGVTLNRAVLMTNYSKADPITISSQLTLDDFGGLRPSASGGLVWSGKITGTGDLVIVTENQYNNSPKTVTISGTSNNYTGVTSIGTVQGGSNTYARLKLGANNVLPFTTVVEIAKSQNTTDYAYTSSTASFDLNGKSQTIAGLYGAGNASVINSASGTTSASLIINLNGGNYTYSGNIDGANNDHRSTVTVKGSGSQTLSGSLTSLNLAVQDSATLCIANSFTGGTLNVGENATLKATNTASAFDITLRGFGDTNSIIAGTIQSNGGTITYTGTNGVGFGGTQDLTGFTLDVQSGNLIYSYNGSKRYNGATVKTADGVKLDMYGAAADNGDVFDVLPSYPLINTASTLATITTGNSSGIDGSYDKQFAGGTGRLSVVKVGTNTQTITGPDNTSATDLIINGGTVELAKTQNVTAFSTIEVNDGGTLYIKNNDILQNTSGDTVLNSGSTLTLEANSQFQPYNLTVKAGSTIQWGIGSTMRIDGLSVESGALVSGAFDLKGGNLTIISNNQAKFSPSFTITNSDTSNQSTFTVAPTSEFDASKTLSTKVSGNTHLVVKLPVNQNNASRLTISNTSNDFTGGLEIEQGTIRVDDYRVLGSSKTIDMDHGALMTKLDFDGYTINLKKVEGSTNDRGAIRLSGGSGLFKAYITGTGNLEIVNDGSVTLTNTDNDYQGITYIGNFNWRNDPNDSSGTWKTLGATLKLGASGVLPDTTVVQFGDGGSITANSTLNLNGYNETVAGIKNSDGKAVITSSSVATLTVKADSDYTYKGVVTNKATVEKQGTGTLTMTGNNTGSFIVSEGTLVLSGNNSSGTYTVDGGTLNMTGNNSGTYTIDGGTLNMTGNNSGTFSVSNGTLTVSGNNTGSTSMTVGTGGTIIPTSTKSLAPQINLAGGTLDYKDPSYLNNSTLTATAGESTIAVPMAGIASSAYYRQLLTGTYNNMSAITNPETMTNMDKIANTAYQNVNGTATFSADIWGDPTKDQSNTNVLQTYVTNTTDSAITLDFAYKFHNDAYLAITDEDGNQTVVMNWSTTGSGSPVQSNTGSFTFEPGKSYFLETRLTRFNKTIGAQAGGVNGTEGTLVGLGAKVSGSTDEYLPLNYDGDNWTFSDGSFTFGTLTYSKDLTINEGASVKFNVESNDFTNSANISGDGTLIINPESGYTHTYTGNVTSNIRKTGDGTAILASTNFKGLTVDSGLVKWSATGYTPIQLQTLELKAGGELEFNFGTYDSGLYDTISLADTGVLSPDGTISLLFDNDDESVWFANVPDEGYQLISGTFDNATLTDMLAGITQDWTLKSNATGLYLMGATTPPTPGTGVPEPSTWALLILGMVALMLLKRSEKRETRSKNI